jgi:hypothetical protein
MRIVIASTFIAAALFGAPALAQSSPVSGSWATVAETPQGRYESTMIVGEDAGAFVVNFEDPAMPDGSTMPSGAITDIVVDGAAFSFKRTLETPQGALELTYTGTVDGDAMTGVANSAFGPVAFTGTRK